MANKWEICFLRPGVPTGAEMIFFHPDSSKNVVFRSLAAVCKARKIDANYPAEAEILIISSLLMDGWEPMAVHGPFLDKYPGKDPDLGPTGYSFRRIVSQ